MVNEMNERNWNDKLDFFMREKVKIHIDLLDGTFLNGFVLKNSKENVWVITEDKLGNVFVFVREISRLQQFHRSEKEVDKDGRDKNKYDRS